MTTGLTRHWTQHNTKNIPSHYKLSASKTILYSENSLLESNTHLTRAQRHTHLLDLRQAKQNISARLQQHKFTQ